MARETTTETPAAPDLATLMADLAALRDEVKRLTSKSAKEAAERGEELAIELEEAAEEARAYAERKAKEAGKAIHAAVVDNPYLALGIAAGIGLLLGAVLRR